VEAQSIKRINVPFNIEDIRKILPEQLSRGHSNFYAEDNQGKQLDVSDVLEISG
jgi:hypothetical protein